MSEAQEPRALFTGWGPDYPQAVEMFTLSEDVWEDIRHINAPHPTKRLIGRKGGQIPMTEAVRLGLVQAPQPDVETQDVKGPAETQAVKKPRKPRTPRARGTT